MNRRESHKLFTTFSICFVPSLEFLFIISVYFTYFPSLYLSISPHLLSISRCLSLSLYSAVVIHSVSQKLVFCLICLFLSPSFHYFIGCVPPPTRRQSFQYFAQRNKIPVTLTALALNILSVPLLHHSPHSKLTSSACTPPLEQSCSHHEL